MKIMWNLLSQFKLVQFRDGRYGARRGLFSYKFLDLHDPKLYAWTPTIAKYRYCRGTRAEAEAAINIYNKHKASKRDVGTIV